MRENRLSEIPSLLEARGQLVDELLGSGISYEEDRLTRLRELEADLMQKLTARRNAALERLSALKTGKQARRAYSVADF